MDNDGVYFSNILLSTTMNADLLLIVDWLLELMIEY